MNGIEESLKRQLTESILKSLKRFYSVYVTDFASVEMPDDYVMAGKGPLGQEFLASIDEAVEQMFLAGKPLAGLKAMNFTDWKTQYVRQRRGR